MLTAVTALVEIVIVVGVALSAVLLKTIDARGFLASVLVGLTIFYGGGVQWFAIVAVFFTLGVAFTFYEYSFKKKLGGAQEKGGVRNWPNILANGGLASLVAVGAYFHPSYSYSALFLGAISTSAADTAATELGLLSGGRPRLLTRPSQPVSPGTSGGVTLLGFGAAVLASVVIGTMAYVLKVGPGTLVLLLACVVGGVSGTVVDSLMGATIQRKGYCLVCLKPTEALRHCGEASVSTGGSRFVENNTVNILATLAGGAASLAVFVAFGATS